VVWAIGGLVYVWPRVWGREELWSWTLALVVLADHAHLRDGLVLTAAACSKASSG